MYALEDFKKPINIVSISIAVLSICLSIYLYSESRRFKRPTYTFSQRHSLIYDSSKSGPNIQVYDTEGILVTKNIYLFESKFWNSGQIPIEPSDIRIPIEVVISPCMKILNCQMIDEVHPKISEFSLSIQNGIKSDTSTINLTWKHLDPGFGIKFQVIYASGKRANVAYRGLIADVSDFTNGQALITKNSWYIILFWGCVFLSFLIYWKVSVILINRLTIPFSIKLKLNQHITTILTVSFSFTICSIFLVVTLYLLYSIFLVGISPPL